MNLFRVSLLYNKALACGFFFQGSTSPMVQGTWLTPNSTSWTPKQTRKSLQVSLTCHLPITIRLKINTAFLMNADVNAIKIGWCFINTFCYLTHLMFFRLGSVAGIAVAMLILGVLLTAIGIFVYLRKTNKRIQDIRIPSRNWHHVIDVIHLTRTKMAHVHTHSPIHFLFQYLSLFWRDCVILEPVVVYRCSKTFAQCKMQYCVSICTEKCVVEAMKCVNVVYICTKYLSKLMIYVYLSTL